MQDRQRVPADAGGHRQAAGHKQAVFTGPSRRAALTETAEIADVPILDGFSHPEQGPIRTWRDALEAESLLFGGIKQPLRGGQLRAISDRHDRPRSAPVAR